MGMTLPFLSISHRPIWSELYLELGLWKNLESIDESCFFLYFFGYYLIWFLRLKDRGGVETIDLKEKMTTKMNCHCYILHFCHFPQQFPSGFNKYWSFNFCIVYFERCCRYITWCVKYWPCSFWLEQVVTMLL